jgi:hypothetical protein
MAILLGLAAFHGAATALVRPPLQVSDETTYFAAVQQATIDRGSPSDAFRRRAAPPAGQVVAPLSEAKPAFELLGSAIYGRALGSATAPTAALILRLVFSLSGVVTVLSTFLIARHLFPANPLVTLGAPLVVATHPVFMTFAAGITPDAPANALSAMALWLGVRFADRTSRGLEPLAMIAAAVGAVAMKDTAFFLLVLLPLAWLARGLAWWHGGRGRADAWLLVAPAVAVVAAAASPVGRWLQSLYVVRASAGREGPMHAAASIVAEAIQQVPTAFQTFWTLGNFGGNRPLLPSPIVWVAALAACAGALGLVRYTCRRPHWELPVSRAAHLRLLAVWLVSLLVLALQPPVRNLLLGTDDVFQGRWMFPGLPLLAVLATLGLSGFLRVPARGLPLLSVFASAWPVVALAGMMIPTYYAAYPARLAMSRLHLRGSYGVDLDLAPIEALIVRPAWTSHALAAWVPLACLALLLVTWNLRMFALATRRQGHREPRLEPPGPRG